MKLDQFLKWKGVVGTGGEAKSLITSGQVKLNGLVETRRGRKLCSGDLVSLNDEDFLVEKDETRDP